MDVNCIFTTVLCWFWALNFTLMFHVFRQTFFCKFLIFIFSVPFIQCILETLQSLFDVVSLFTKSISISIWWECMEWPLKNEALYISSFFFFCFSWISSTNFLRLSHLHKWIPIPSHWSFLLHAFIWFTAFLLSPHQWHSLFDWDLSLLALTCEISMLFFWGYH